MFTTAAIVTRVIRREMGAKVRKVFVSIVVYIACCAPPASAQTDASQEFTLTRRPVPTVQSAFQIKYVAQDTVYLAAGRSTGLAEGMKLTVKRLQNVSTVSTTGEGTGAEVVAELTVIAVTDTSAVCNIEKATTQLQKGDYAYITAEEAEALAQKQALSGVRKYPQVITFTEGDPMEEELRAAVPRPPLPEVNRVRGRLGFEYSQIQSRGTVATQSSQMGLVFRADMTRLGGTYWNLSGYWRGRLMHSASDQQSLQDLINRTYHLSMTYENPNSHWVAGFGRLYVPWASSLQTIDGGYLGRRMARVVTAGVFAGTAPDPTSWSYDPNRRIGGMFINFEAGSFDHVHYYSTSGIAVSMLKWDIDRPFIFFENSFAYKHYLSFYHSLQADDPKPVAGQPAIGSGVSQSFATLRIQPIERISFDVNHNYLRDIPTFDSRLIGTGLLDKYLFQGLSVGTRVETFYHIAVYGNVGRSNRSGDAKAAWNRMYGVAAARIWRTGLRADVRYSEFDNSFGRGNYRAFSLSRNVREGMRLEMQVGRQFLTSPFTSQTSSEFLNANADINLGARYFVQAAYTTERGGPFDYDQWTVTTGYRFDNRMRGTKQ
jgi:hypothetical protein